MHASAGDFHWFSFLAAVFPPHSSRLFVSEERRKFPEGVRGRWNLPIDRSVNLTKIELSVAFFIRSFYEILIVTFCAIRKTLCTYILTLILYILYKLSLFIFVFEQNFISFINYKRANEEYSIDCYSQIIFKYWYNFIFTFIFYSFV